MTSFCIGTVSLINSDLSQNIFRFSSDYNKKVQQSIVEEILGQHDCKFSEKDIRSTIGYFNDFIYIDIHVAAVRRCYEHLR